MKETILVTGSEGSLMQSLIPLLDDEYEIIGVDNFSRYPESVKSIHGRGNYDMIIGDLVDDEFVQNVIWDVEPTYIIQGAAKIYGVGGFNKYAADILGDDIALHRNVLNAVKDKKNFKRMIYISSSMVYEGYTNESMVQEDIVSDNYFPVPRTDYGLSKYVNERLCVAYQKQYDIDYTIWRPFNIITPYESTEGKEQGISHVFADFLQAIIVDRLNPLPIYGDGEQVRCFTWIGDVVDAIAKHSFSEKSRNEVFNLGNAQPVTMKELAGTIYDSFMRQMKDFSMPPLEFEHKAPYVNDVRYRVPDVSKAQYVLDWSASRRLEECVDELVEYYIVHKLKW